jgi:hypothetical protein
MYGGLGHSVATLHKPVGKGPASPKWSLLSKRPAGLVDGFAHLLDSFPNARK